MEFLRRRGLTASEVETFWLISFRDALPPDLRDKIMKYVHGDPGCALHYMVMYDDNNNKPVDLVNDSAYPASLRGPVPPGYTISFKCVDDGMYNYNKAPSGEDPRDHVFVDAKGQADRLRCFCRGCMKQKCEVWLWRIDEEEEKDSHWDSVVMGEVDWEGHYGVCMEDAVDMCWEILAFHML